jgi:hypothetical protein
MAKRPRSHRSMISTAASTQPLLGQPLRVVARPTAAVL